MSGKESWCGRQRGFAKPLLFWLTFFVCCNALAQELTVSAASSLTDALRVLGRDFEKNNPGVKVVLNFAASDVLLRQIVQGAQVDVFASADAKAMDDAAARDLVDTSTRVDFARNRLVVVLPRESRLRPTSLSALNQPAIRQIAISQPAAVPVGRYAKAALDQAQLWDALSNKFVFTQNVRQTLDYVARGEVDAGFVYLTDAALLPGKVKIAFEVATPQRIIYPIAVTKRAAQPKLARGFVDLVKSPRGRKVLAGFGFVVS